MFWDDGWSAGAGMGYAGLTRMNNRPPRPARTQAFFEDFPLCPHPPHIPVKAIHGPDALKAMFVEDVPLARSLVRAAFLATGFTRFHRTLPERLDAVLDATNQIAGIGPVVAATMALIDDARPADPFVRAAAMLKACWDMHTEIRAGQFPPDVSKGQPLEMRQYLNLFGTSIVVDQKSFRLSKTAEVSRILVLARGKSYVVDFGPDAESSSVSAIADALTQVWTFAAAEEPEASPGMLGTLSSVSMDLQAEGFRAGLEDPVNRRSYESITNTFLTLCLDVEHTPQSYAEAAALAHSGNCGNRWFHASLQLVVFGNSKACVICDFNAGLGGNTMFRAAADIHRRSLAWSVPRSAWAGSEPAGIDKIPWHSGEPSLDRVRAALDSLRDDQQATFELRGYGRTAFASHGLDPVPAFAIAVQLAVFRLTGELARIRQFLTMTRYRAQNVVLTPAGTPEMSAVVQALSQPGDPATPLRPLIEAALESQRAQNRQARSGMSVARSLGLFRAVHTGLRERYVELVLGRTFKLLRALKLQHMPPPTDIALSHPGLFPEVPVGGRPGIRLPYLKCFGLHYLIWDDRITLTFMPSTSWTIPNAALAAELESCLDVVVGAWSGTPSSLTPRTAVVPQAAGISLS